MTSILKRAATPLLMALALAGTGTAFAQGDRSRQAGTVGEAAVPKTERTERAMFARADKNKDGRLTRAEAKGSLPLTHMNFASIDTDQRGWISSEQFVAFTNSRVEKDASDILRIGQRP